MLPVSLITSCSETPARIGLINGRFAENESLTSVPSTSVESPYLFLFSFSSVSKVIASTRSGCRDDLLATEIIFKLYLALSNIF